MYSVIYPKAGSVVLELADGSLVDPGGRIQQVTFGSSIETTDMEDGNSFFPFMSYVRRRTGRISVVMASFQPAIYAALTGGSFTGSVSSTLWAIDEEGLIPATSPYTVTLRQTPLANTDLVYFADGTALTRVATAPTAGQYSISGNTLTFNAADAGKSILVTYQYTGATAGKLVIPATAYPRPMKLILATEALDEADQVYDVNLIMTRCMPDGEVPLPNLQREAQTWQFNLKLLKPAPGKNAIEIIYQKR